MSSLSAQLTLATQFASFLVAVAGLAVVGAQRGMLSGRTSRRILLSAGFAMMAAASFWYGSFLPRGTVGRAVMALRALGTLALALGSMSRHGGRRVWTAASTRAWWWLGLGYQGAAMAVAVGWGSTIVSYALADVATACIAVALAQEGRRAVASRVATVTGGALLVMVLVVSLTLSALVDSNVKAQSLTDLAGSAHQRAADIQALSADRLQGPSTLLVQLVESYVANRCSAPTKSCVSQAVLAYATKFFPSFGVMWVSSDSAPVVSSPSLLQSVGSAGAGSLAAAPAVRQAVSKGREVATIVRLPQRLMAVSVAPEVSSSPMSAKGAAVVTLPLGNSFLATSRRSQSGRSLSLWSPSASLASSGPEQPSNLVAPAVNLALSRQEVITRRAGASYVAVEPLFGSNGHPVAALVVAEPRSVVVGLRDSFLRRLFMAALGGTTLALLLAAMVGDRVGMSMRRLTEAAEAIQAGEGGVRAGVESEDEVGRLGMAFDAMSASIEEKADALRRAALDESRLRGRLEEVVGNMGEALVAVDRDGTITDFNHAAEELFMHQASEALGKPFASVVRVSLVPTADESGGGMRSGAKAGARLLGDLIAFTASVKGRRSTVEGAVEREEGEPVPVSCSVGVLSSEEGVVAGGWVVVFRDLRREREIERMKTQFLSRISHELRTPLTGIMGFADLLVHREVPAEHMRAWHAQILEQAKRIARTIELLEFVASTEAGRPTLHPGDVELCEMVGEVVDKSKRRYPERQILASIPSGPMVVVADRRWLVMALGELIDNAVKFSDPASTVELALAQDGEEVILSVADSGSGMDEQVRAAAFGSFEQGDASDTRVAGGLGLGLALVSRVVAEHGGQISCESSPGQGSLLAVHLPRRVSVAASAPER